jgi:hypothetical protein
VLNGVAVSVTQRATPLHSRSILNADLGLFAQDQWTMRRLTLNLGVRFDYLNGAIPPQSFTATDVGRMGAETAGRFVPPVRTFAAVTDTPNLKDINPRVGASYDLFGNGKTAVKASLTRYVVAPSGPSSPGTYNPLNNVVTSTTRAWADSNGNGFPDCDFTNSLPNGECQGLANAAFGQIVVNTNYDPAVRTGWFHRSYDWETSVGVQQQLMPGISANVSYFRRWYGNFTVTDNMLVGPADYDPYCLTAPSDNRLPNGGAQQICGLYDINPGRFGRVSNLVTFASNFGRQYEHWNGVDVATSLHLLKGILLQGGVSTGKTMTDNCDVIARINNPGTRFCHVDTGFLTQIKLLGSYTLPWDVQLSSTFQSLAGPPITATYAAPASAIIPSLGRPLAGGARTASVELVEPGKTYGERLYQVDFRLAKTLRARSVRVTPEVNVYNLLNSSSVVRLNTTYGPQWQVPQGVLLGRFARIGAKLTF